MQTSIEKSSDIFQNDEKREKLLSIHQFSA